MRKNTDVLSLDEIDEFSLNNDFKSVSSSKNENSRFLQHADVNNFSLTQRITAHMLYFFQLCFIDGG